MRERVPAAGCQDIQERLGCGELISTCPLTTIALARFSLVATGGTFDEIHVGHVALLAKAFEIGKKVIIGVSSEEFAA